MEQKIEQLTEKEKAWIASQLASAVRFVNLYRPEQGGRPVTLAALDRAFAAFLASNPKDTEIIKAIINVVGTSFGQFLVDGLGLKWVIATDNQGSELAAHGL